MFFIDTDWFLVHLLCLNNIGLHSTSGIWSRRNYVAEADAEVIRLVREAGAIPFVITIIPECGMWWESVNTIHGRCLNPYDVNRIVGGSSGGEACLLVSNKFAFNLFVNG